MRALTLTELDGLRSVPGRAALLYLTDRCPVGCAHCSVDSRLDSPTIVDRAAFRSIVTDLAAIDGLVVVGISGGEPFVERGALIEAVSLLADAGKLVVPYTFSKPRLAVAALSHLSDLDLERFILQPSTAQHR